MLRSGLRVGSPASTNPNGVYGWLVPFFRICDENNYRVDYVAVHEYWYATGKQFYDRMNEYYNLFKRPIWITEFNYGANWTTESWPDPDRKGTPANYELEQAGQVVEQLIRPTGLIDPVVEIHKIDGQIDDLISEINKVVAKKARVLVTTLTKKMAESLTAYLTEQHLRVKYMHSDIDTLERIEIIAGLRRGDFDVLVGINLLREGLDIPEVQLVAILDADKEGFLRSETALVQTIGRAARNSEAKVIMYADRITDSMQRAIDETNRRRQIQSAYNKEHNITPKTIIKDINNTLEISKKIEDDTKTSIKDINKELSRLATAMKVASANLDFELAIKYREQIAKLKESLKKSNKV